MGNMQYTANIKNGEKLSKLALGCMRFPKDEKEVDKLVGRAIERGINYFDTAYIYPGNEAAVGRALTPERREKVNLATKLPPYLVKKYDDFDKLFMSQLGRLKTDHIDYYLIHSLSAKSEWSRLVGIGVQEWIKQKKASGEIRNIGFSFHGGTMEFKSIIDAYEWEFTMIQYNYLDENRQAGKAGLQYAHSKGLPVVIMEPLRGGLLATKLPPKALAVFDGADVKRSPAEWGLRWLYNQPEVTTVLSGMNTMEMLDENLRVAETASVEELSENQLSMFSSVRDILLEKQLVPCTGCGYCMPCPSGVDIPLCFATYNDRAISSPNRARMDYLLRLGSHHASLCTKCGKCEVHCPQKIEIRERLGETTKAMESFPYKPLRFIVSKVMKRN